MPAKKEDPEFEPTVIGGRVWLVCPFGGAKCGRVLADFGSMGLDAMEWHVQHVHYLQLIALRSSR